MHERCAFGRSSASIFFSRARQRPREMLAKQGLDLVVEDDTSWAPSLGTTSFSLAAVLSWLEVSNTRHYITSLSQYLDPNV